MSDVENQRTEEEIAVSVAEALTEMGFSASAQNTGGGIYCVILQRKGGGEIVWGTADFNWGASVADADLRIVLSITTECSSESQDISAIVEAVKDPSIAAGAKF